MEFTGRTRELGLLRGLLDRRAPQLIRVTGLPGIGKSALVRRATADYDGLAVTCPPLPAPALRTALARGLARVGLEVARGGEAPPWSSLFDIATSAARGAPRPWVLVLDDAHRLVEGRARFLQPLVAALERAAAEGIAMHVVLIGREGSLPNPGGEGGRTPAAMPTAETTTVSVGPLPLRTAATHLPGSSGSDRIRSYAVFGGIPRVLASLDTAVTVGTNVRRLLLDSAGPLADAPLAWLEREVQAPPRYVAILGALSGGPADWAAVHAGVPDLTRSGQVAPYLKRLGELGMIGTSRSLDARARSRSRRYALSDPFLAFWLRFVLPWRAAAEANRDDPPLRRYYAEEVRPRVDGHVQSVFPVIARQHMRSDAIETLGANARENGALWGTPGDIPVAGILTSGAAYYGTCAWMPPKRSASPLDDLDARVRETRYGFGRERRLRLVFTGRTTPTWLRRAVARRRDAQLIEAGDLVGT